MKSILITILSCLVAVTAARAHAFVDHADPLVGSTVKSSPTEVKIFFTEKLVLPFSDLKILDSAGQEMDKKDKHLDPSNGAVLIVSVPPLKPGRYNVSWRATSVDTHVTHGTFTVSS
jgi:methionine-rich copper-binding protein CopC